MAFANAFYNALVKRNSVYVTAIFVGAFSFGVGFDVGVTSFWDRWNKGNNGRISVPNMLQRKTHETVFME
ncbi:subunit 9 of the ubiquinol cytochrome-c reductase complex, QCR9 [Serpula lacrymans var. lacrymans S7.9]|uniref:Complex III subunit 9 n=1 Tax=Serpula lacrymans var. lacrymans (strain S7.9) TaxID=578457 RepID=F8NM00_SERL9|nr:subunit 9 of the ubiquinol cytochrome-c reductase complex, QCR9 [Serpula lacrymans var. lacrymans S7.9]EGO27304.1 subunit 9 of the ubiquinol cytochrome-c reductase complex, QCR9 [Serpula lacrymans var. lacrymans S7.9]